MRLYVTTDEARELAAGRVPASVETKAKAKLKPAPPIPGQTDIFDQLEDSRDDNATRRQPEAPAA